MTLSTLARCLRSRRSIAPHLILDAKMFRRSRWLPGWLSHMLALTKFLEPMTGLKRLELAGNLNHPLGLPVNIIVDF